MGKVEWRIGVNHQFWDDPPGTPTFHAYPADRTVEPYAICNPGTGLRQTAWEPNEGSHFCPDCLELLKNSSQE